VRAFTPARKEIAVIDRTHAFHGHARPPCRGRAALRPLAAFALLLAVVLAGCGGGEPPEEEDPPVSGTEIVNLTRTWTFLQGKSAETATSDSPGHWPGFGAVYDEHVFTEKSNGFLEPGRGPQAKGEINSGVTGKTYGVVVDSPNPSAENDYALGAGVNYVQRMYYRKVAPAAYIDMKITALKMEAGDGNNNRYPPGCNATSASYCAYRLSGKLSYTVAAQRLSPSLQSPFWLRIGVAWLDGLLDSWEKTSTDNYGPDSGSGPLWNNLDLKLTVVPGGVNTATLELKEEKVVRVPLDAVALGETFVLTAFVDASAVNARQAESGITVRFQDPVSGKAIDMTPVGVEGIAVPDPEPVIGSLPQPEPTCTGTVDPAAGRFELMASTMQAAEGLPLRLRVRRVGGSNGIASVQLASRAGSATAVSDFASITQTLVFGDGQDADRIVDLPIPDDALLEGDEAFELQLSDPQGCSALGTTASATVTIVDDEAANQRYTLGGTVSGLVGSGLFVRSNGFDVRVDAPGPFTLPGGFASGTVYNLDVEVQPSNPLQVCRVTNGQGTIANANVTDLAVVCDPPAPPLPGGALDPGFAGGMVSNPSHGRILSMALQTDGRIVVLTDFNKLLRYQVDGTLDPSFGSAGVVSATLGGSALDLLRAVALQADGGILVAGLARPSGGSLTAEDMGVKRYLPNGTVDTAFGTGGFVRVDIAGRADDATTIAVQPDGKIVLGGSALVTAVGASDLALARLDASGVLDTGFGSGGKLTANIGGNFDTAAAMALQADGAIVLVGRAASSGGATPDTGVLRVSASGVVDLALKLPLTTDWDEATGVAIQSDGKIVLTLEARATGGLYQHALARLKVDGTLDETFGTLGVALAGFSVGGDHAKVPVLLGDGRILTAGFSRGTTSQLSDFDDFLITRHLADGALDTSFGSGGKLVVDFFGASDGANALLLQPDGRAVVGGLARSGTSNGLGMLRLLP
jgi:uncharacterized delta-60 repeat protein